MEGFFIPSELDYSSMTASPKPFRVFYDEQCEICQAGVTWLRLLDRKGLVRNEAMEPVRLASIDPRLNAEACARELHVLGPEGELWTGGAAVRRLARLFPVTWVIGTVLETPVLRQLSDAAYRFVAAHRYQISKCRGGACRTLLTTRPQGAGGLSAFWTCYSTGLLLRLPIALLFAVRQFGRNSATYLRTRRRRLSFLGGKLDVFFLGSAVSDVVPPVFGEQFWMLAYDGLLIDPGGPRMSGSVSWHLGRLAPGSIRGIIATHAHEEHIGNLALASRLTGAPVLAAEACLPAIREPAVIPLMRSLVIGQPEPYDGAARLGPEVAGATRPLKVFSAPGHCDGHIVLYDPVEKLLISGDAFIGTYFSSPNPDVDSLRWLESIRHLAALPIEVMLTGHGQIFTRRADFPDWPGVVIRRDPKDVLREKLSFLEWLREQIVSGVAEGLPPRAIEATLFPWNRRWSWENLFNDELARVLSGGEFSRSELVRSFLRRPEDVDPLVYEARGYLCRVPASEPSKSKK